MRALISVSDKKGIVSFASSLEKLGYTIISTGGTYKTLKENGIRVITIEEVTQFPEMLDGRVKTLHPMIHGGLLSLRDNPEHMKTCKEHQIESIDLVVVNLYPFEKTIKKENVTLEEAIENIDIGGPSMLRSASKNYRSVGVVVDPNKYEDIIKEMTSNSGELTLKTKENLACEAFAHTARYDAIISNYLSEKMGSNDCLSFPETLTPIFKKVSNLRYGENPHQKAAFYKASENRGLSGMKQLHGKELSYNNIVDLEAAALIVKDFDIPGVTIIKHTNPCGSAIADSIEEAYQKAYDADPVSAFGSIVGLNRKVDEATAEKISKTFVEAIIAPGFERKAFEKLSKKPSIRLIELPNLKELGQLDVLKHIDGGLLLQSADTKTETENEFHVASKIKPNMQQSNDLLFANSIVKYVKSNAIVIAKDGVSLGVGAGQMSRVEAVEIAIKKAGKQSSGAVLASDAFFPFKDSVELASKAGIKAIIQPGGSKRDDESITTCNEHDMIMVMTGTRHFRH